jgi:hypothetical protein
MIVSLTLLKLFITCCLVVQNTLLKKKKKIVFEIRRSYFWLQSGGNDFLFKLLRKGQRNFCS